MRDGGQDAKEKCQLEKSRQNTWRDTEVNCKRQRDVSTQSVTEGSTKTPEKSSS